MIESGRLTTAEGWQSKTWHGMMRVRDDVRLRRDENEKLQRIKR